MALSQLKHSEVTPLMWKSLDTFTSCFGYLWSNPIEWNPSKKILVYNPPSKKLGSYYFSVFFCLPLYTICSFGLLFSVFFRVVELSMISIFVTLFFLLLIMIGIGFEACFLAYGKEYVTAFNALLILEKSLHPIQPPKKGNKAHTIYISSFVDQPLGAICKKCPSSNSDLYASDLYFIEFLVSFTIKKSLSCFCNIKVKKKQMCV
jgi:hypothetical protein